MLALKIDEREHGARPGCALPASAQFRRSIRRKFASPTHDRLGVRRALSQCRWRIYQIVGITRPQETFPPRERTAESGAVQRDGIADQVTLKPETKAACVVFVSRGMDAGIILRLAKAATDTCD